MRIRKGSHYDNKWLSTLPIIFKREFKRTYIFTGSCRYIFPAIDQEDVNKLFGICFIHVHWASARFGWSYNLRTDTISIYAYCYKQGKKEVTLLREIEVGEPVQLILTTGFGYNCFQVKTLNGNNVECLKRGGYYWPPFTLGSYFGGNNPAPHDIEIIELKNNLLTKWKTKLKALLN
jgi:hypothetical protein